MTQEWESQAQIPQESCGQAHRRRGACGVFRGQQRATTRTLKCTEEGKAWCESGRPRKEATALPRFKVRRAGTRPGHGGGMEKEGDGREGTGWYRWAMSPGLRLLQQQSACQPRVF